MISQRVLVPRGNISRVVKYHHSWPPCTDGSRWSYLLKHVSRAPLSELGASDGPGELLAVQLVKSIVRAQPRLTAVAASVRVSL